MRIKRSLPKKPAELLALGLRYLEALSTLALYQTRTGKVPSLEQLKEILTRFQALINAAANLDRVQVALRRKAQNEVEAVLKRIIHFLEAVADDDDLLVLQAAGIELCRSAWRKSGKSNPQPAKETVADVNTVVIAPAPT